MSSYRIPRVPVYVTLERPHGDSPVRPRRPPLPQGAGLHGGGVPRSDRARRRAEGGEEGRDGDPVPAGPEHRADLREDLDAHALRVRGRGRGPGRLHDLPRPVGLADRAQGVREGHRAGARPDVRRDRVPRGQPGGRRGAGRPRGRARLQRSDRRLAPDPDARRRPHDDRAHHQAADRIAFAYLGDARFNMGNSYLVTGALLGMDVRIVAPKAYWPAEEIVDRARELAVRSGARVTLTETSRRGSRAPTSSPPTSGCPWGSPRRSGTSASSPSARTP
jgi:hypothetical protein